LSSYLSDKIRLQLDGEGSIEDAAGQSDRNGPIAALFGDREREGKVGGVLLLL